MSDSNRDKLISIAYSAVLAPDTLHETLDSIDDLIFSDLPENTQFNLGSNDKNSIFSDHLHNCNIDPNLLTHFQRAHDIQLRIGRVESGKCKVEMLLDASPNPAFVFNQFEHIIAANSRANAIAKNCETLSEVCGNDDILQSVRKFVYNGDELKTLVVAGYINTEKNSNTCILIKKLEESLCSDLTNYDRQFGKHYIFTIADLKFDYSKTEIFKSTYGLTTAEVDIAIELSSGKLISEIAKIRNVAVITIRTQIKSIKRKTQSRNVPAIVRLLCGFSAGILISTQLTSTNEPSQPKPTEQFKLRDGRRMFFLEQGCPNGAPVVMIHNMPYGVELPARAITAAKRLNLRIIAPYRSGYGDSDIIVGVHGDKLLDEVASDICELLDKLSIDKATIVGQTIGSVYALRFARLFPKRVAHLFAISRAPIWKDSWLKGMPKRQLFTMRIAKHFPKLLPYIMRATVMYIDKGHVNKLIHGLCKDSSVDLQALENNPEIYELMANGCVVGLKQGAEAFCNDCHLSIMDFSEEAQSLSHSFHIIHGDADEIVNISQSKEFARVVPGTKLEVVKDAGQLLFYSHWDRVLKAIKNKL